MRKYCITLLTVILSIALSISVFAANTPIKIGVSDDCIVCCIRPCGFCCRYPYKDWCIIF